MAEKRFSLKEVMDGLDGSDFEESDDDFDGYLDMDSDSDEEEHEEFQAEWREEREECQTEWRKEQEREEHEECQTECREVQEREEQEYQTEWREEHETEGREEYEIYESVGANVEIGEDSSSSQEEDTMQAGCTASVEGESPLEFFSLLLTDDILMHIVTQTNLSAQQFIESHELAPHSRVRRWSKGEHDINELRRFLAIIIIMGLVRYPQMEHHWATQWPYSNTHFSSVSCK